MMRSSESRGRTVAAARGAYLTIAAVIAVSIVIQLVLLVTGGADANSGETGASASVGVRLVRLFSFFTIDSNIIVLLVCLLAAAHPMRSGFWWEALRLNALVAITVTGAVYATLLAPNIHLDGWALATMIGLHAVSPVGFVGAWLVFGPRPRIRMRHLPAAFALPALWLAATFARGVVTGWYPYPFLDAAEIGFPVALRNALLILVAAAILALIFRAIDAKLPAALTQGTGR